MRAIFLVVILSLLSFGLCLFREKRDYNEFAEASRTRSLSGTRATDGNNVTNAMVLCLLKVGLLDGYAVRKVKMFNDRVYLARYRRSYWLGSRYYYLDNRYYLETRDTCAYRMNATERAGLAYEDEVPIVDVIYQCQRYAQYCCGLDCCDLRTKRQLSYGWRNLDNSAITSCQNIYN